MFYVLIAIFVFVYFSFMLFSSFSEKDTNNSEYIPLIVIFAAGLGALWPLIVLGYVIYLVTKLIKSK